MNVMTSKMKPHMHDFSKRKYPNEISSDRSAYISRNKIFSLHKKVGINFLEKIF